MNLFKKKRLKNIVKQKYGTDCGVACLAMFLDKSYEEIENRVALILNRKPPIDFMNNVEIAIVLYHNLRKPMQLYTLLDGVPAIISVPSLMTKKKFHYVYWDGFNIYDPSNFECYTTADFKNDLPMADSIVCSYTIELENIPSHFYSEFDWGFINNV